MSFLTRGMASKLWLASCGTLLLATGVDAQCSRGGGRGTATGRLNRLAVGTVGGSVLPMMPGSTAYGTLNTLGRSAVYPTVDQQQMALWQLRQQQWLMAQAMAPTAAGAGGNVAPTNANAGPGSTAENGPSDSSNDARAAARQRYRERNAARELSAAEQAEQRGQRSRAAAHYRRAAQILPDSEVANTAQEALQRLAPPSTEVAGR